MDTIAQDIPVSTEASIEENLIWTSLPKLLRALGACVLLGAAACFLLQGWQDMNHIARYFSFLGFTALLSAAGFFCGLRLKEDKGARTFLAISAAVVPVHFCQLGALIYSQTAQASSSYPAWLLWKAPSLGAACLTTVAGILSLLPLCYIAFSSLARTEAARISLIYMVLCSALLIPSREPDTIALLGLALFIAGTYFEVFYASRKAILKTVEGGFVRLMIFAPVMLMIGRTLNLYSASALFVAMLLTGATLVLFFVIPGLLRSSLLKSFSQHLAAISAFFAWFAVVVALGEAGQLSVSLVIPVVLIPYAGILSLMSLQVSAGETYRRSAAVLVLGAGLLQLKVFPGFASAFICMAGSVATLAYSYAVRSKYLLFASLAGFGWGLVYTISFAFEQLPVSPWLCLAVLGMGIVLASSYLERNALRVIEHSRAFSAKFRSW